MKAFPPIMFTMLLSVSAVSSVAAERGDQICDFEKFSGFRAGYTKTERIAYFGTGFIANPQKQYIRKYGPKNKLGPKQAADVIIGNEFVSYYVNVKDKEVGNLRFNFRTYDDGECYLVILKGGYDGIRLEGKIR